MLPPSAKTRKCAHKACRKQFTPERAGQVVCTWECGLAKNASDVRLATARRQRREEKVARTDTANKLRALKPRKYWLAKAKTALHAYVRLRDIKFGFKCICCGQPFEPNKPGGSVDAGHFRSVGSAKHMELVEENIHAQRKGCNRSGQNRYEAYRIGLIDRYGHEYVDRLEQDQEPRKHGITELMAIATRYRMLTKQLQETT